MWCECGADEAPQACKTLVHELAPIMERLGHSNITVTMNTYGHLFPRIDELLTNKLDQVYRDAISR